MHNEHTCIHILNNKNKYKGGILHIGMEGATITPKKTSSAYSTLLAPNPRMFLRHKTVKKIFRSSPLSKGNHGKRYMNLICSFLSDFPFNAGDEVDVLDGQDMWCPAYILYIDFRDSRVLIGQKYFSDVYDEWLSMSRVMPSNTRRFIKGQEPRLNQMIEFNERYVRYVGKIKAVSTHNDNNYIIEYIDIKQNRKEIAIPSERFIEKSSHYSRLETIKGQVKIFSTYTEKQLNGLRMLPDKKYFRKRF